MPKIIDILAQHTLDKESLAHIYKEHFSKTLSKTAVHIKDEERAELLPFVKKEEKKADKKAETKEKVAETAQKQAQKTTQKKSPKTPGAKKEDIIETPSVEKKTQKQKTAVFKAEEVSFGDDFLSGLGFGPKQDEETDAPVAEKDDTDIFIPPTKAEEEKPFVSHFGNARVIGSDPDMPKKEKKAHTHTVAPKQHFERKKPESETKGKTFHTFTSNGPTFSQGTYKAPIRPGQGGTEQKNTATKSTHVGQNVAKGQEKQGKNNDTHSETGSTSRQVPKREAATSGTLIKKQEIILSDTVSVKEFSEKMGVPFPELMKKFMANKILVNINSTIDFDTAALIGEEFHVKVKRQAGSISVEDMMSGNLQAILEMDKDTENKIKRPPVVTIMGHVDHGKTKLLDYLRQTNVVSGEAGGITQSIGASQIIHNEEKITFIDTPGHELFTSLRARGAKITNIVIIVIACDDGIKPQTVEAINHAKDAGVPIIVAITKIDKGIDNTDMIKGQMAEHGLTPEDWGGDVPVVHVSAMTGQGIPALLEQIILHAEMLELAYNPDRNAVGVILESTKDPKQGILTTMLLMTGTMKVGDIVMIHNTYGKVRKMLDWTGKEIKTSTGGDPVMILGMQDLPEPGRVAEVVDTERQAQQRIALVVETEKAQKDAGGLQAMMSQIASGEVTTLKVVMKADSFGSLEAVKYAIDSMTPPENVTIKLIHSDVGTFGESDIALAQASDAIILGFNVPIPASIMKKADQMKITVKTYDIIYEMIDYIDGILKGMIKIELKEVTIGMLTILGVFYKKEKEMIIGGKVIEGKVKNGVDFRLRRKGDSGEDEVVGQGKVTSLKREQENVNEVAIGHECGMKVRVSKKVVEGDRLEFFVME